MVSLILGFVWVLAATVTALMPMRLQYIPGISLLIAAPVLIIWLSVDYGWWVGALALAAFLSMFRRPLLYFIARLRGQSPEIPK